MKIVDAVAFDKEYGNPFSWIDKLGRSLDSFFDKHVAVEIAVFMITFCLAVCGLGLQRDNEELVLVILGTVLSGISILGLILICNAYLLRSFLHPSPYYEELSHLAFLPKKLYRNRLLSKMDTSEMIIGAQVSSKKFFDARFSKDVTRFGDNEAWYVTFRADVLFHGSNGWTHFHGKTKEFSKVVSVFTETVEDNEELKAVEAQFRADVYSNLAKMDKQTIWSSIPELNDDIEGLDRELEDLNCRFVEATCSS